MSRLIHLHNANSGANCFAKLGVEQPNCNHFIEFEIGQASYEKLIELIEREERQRLMVFVWQSWERGEYC